MLFIYLPISKALIKEPKLLHSSLNQEHVLSCLNLNPAFVYAFSHSREIYHYSVYRNKLPYKMFDSQLVL